MTDSISPVGCPPITTLLALFYHFVTFYVRLNFDIVLVCRRPRQLPLMRVTRVQMIIPNLTPVNYYLQESHAPAFRSCPLRPRVRRLRPPLLRQQTWRQSILVSKNHALLRSVDACSGGCGSRSGGRAPLRRLRPALGADWSVISNFETGTWRRCMRRARRRPNV